MDYVGLVYLGIFSLAWLFGLKDNIESKEKWYFFVLSLISGSLIIVSVVLTWPGELPQVLKYYWKYVLVFIIVAESFIMKQELSILPERMKEKEGIEMKMDKFTIAFSVFIAVALFGPGLYYGYKIAFL